MLKGIKNLKSALTLGELLIVFLIMGIVAAMSLIAVKPQEKSLKYVYSRIYNTLGTAFYNTSIDIDEDLMNDENMVDGFPETSELFCKVLLEYINTKDTDSDTDSCGNKTIDINDAEPDFTQDPHFIVSNGVKVWIGVNSKDKDSDGDFSIYSGKDSENNDISLRYYVVFADLNGDMGPNTAETDNGRMADIVGFIVTEDYDVIPIGQPEIDTRYLTVNVVYFAMSDSADEEDYLTSDSMSYLKAKRYAWGLDGDDDDDSNKFYVSASEPMSINFYDNIDPDSPFYLNYDSEDTEISEIMAYSYKDTPYDDDDGRYYCEDEDGGTVDPAACYISISDYY